MFYAKIFAKMLQNISGIEHGLKIDSGYFAFAQMF